ncbi:protein phosphatase 1 regulatory subunit 15B [Electrophorus electricus]|uniref:Protein phosphatase 1 regulatory subunit 15A/B C-terminal domain-containing protein n=1 Tax=Electrophorus electricus TaxID=8005 RepID=A0A4W4GJ71_ELEEL|nr:protein phosphatase 1 regulatory subunit 15B [Electrophorus electricus]
MFRSMSSEEPFSKGVSQPPPTGLERADVTRHESSWTSTLSLLSRPAWTLLQKYLPGRSHTPSLTHWSGQAGKSNVDTENSLLANLDNLMPAAQHSAGLSVASVACVHCLHGNSRFLGFASSDTHTLNWLKEDPLHALGVQNSTGAEAQHLATGGYLTMVRRFLSQVFLNMASSQKDVGRAERVQSQLEASKSWSWDLLRGADEPQSVLPNLSQSGKLTDTKSLHSGANCTPGRCHPADCSSAVVFAKPTELFVRSNDVELMHHETAGLLRVKEPEDNGGLHMPGPESLPSTDQLASVHQHNVVGHLTDTTAVLTPEQDNGYSSLEEENANTKQHNMKLVCEKPGQSELDSPGPSQEGEAGRGGEGEEEPIGDAPCEAAGNGDEEQKEAVSPSEPTRSSQATSSLSVPNCSNRAIAYIMGNPCSDDSDSEDDSDWDSDEDDGFDSEGSSRGSNSEGLDDSEDEDDLEGDELDPESETMWNSLCQNADPYNPRNFTAPIRTAPKPRAAAVDSPLSGSPAGPAFTPSPSPSPSPLQLEDEESTDEACSIDEEESLKLWNSFSCSSDPYSPLNFQAPLRTQEPGRSRSKKVRAVGPPVYTREEAEERLDSGFSEAAPAQGHPGSTSCVRLKKVTFVEEVEEFYASSDEDRRGPWEEFARDRCRFQRRVQEVEETISYCLAPTFRLLVFQRLHHS